MPALVESTDFFRIDASRKLSADRRSELGQFMTPAPTARLMASMFEANGEDVRLLDAGAGVGSLTAAFVDEIASRPTRPKAVRATAYEIDSGLAEYLATTLDHCSRTCQESGIDFKSELLRCDFIDDGA